MTNRGRFVLHLVWLFGATSCGGAVQEVVKPPTVNRVPESAQTIRFALVVEGPTESERMRNWTARFTDDIRGAVLESGFALMTTPQQASSRLIIKASFEKYNNAWENVDLRAIVEHEGRVIDQASYRPGSLWYDAPTGQQARELINRVAASPRLAALQSPVAAQPVARVEPPPPATPKRTGPVYSTGAPQRNAFALVIGIERYRDIAVAATGARYDAEGFALMAQRTLGVPADNVRVAIDDRATRTDIESHVEWLKTNVPADGRIYFFFSGHGAPQVNTATASLLPFDADPKFVERTGISISALLSSLAKSPAREIVAFVDSCFSGAGGRSVLPPGARPLVAVKAIETDEKVALFSASGASEISGPASSGNNGLFTHHLLEGLGRARADIDGDGGITLHELAEWVGPRVVREAKRSGRDQRPAISIGARLAKSNDLVLATGVSGSDAP